MTEEQLKMLDAVARAGSFRAAAAGLGRSQSAVSKAVMAFERQLGFAVFSREHYRPSLTPRGGAFVERVRSLIDEIERLRAYGRELVGGGEPAFGVAVHHISPIDRVLDALGTVSGRFPNTRFDLSIEAGRGAFNRLKDGKVDLAIGHEINADPELEVHTLFDIAMVLVRAPTFLAGASEEAVISRQTALRLPQVVVRDASAVEGGVPFPLLDGKGHQWLVNDFTTKKQIILAGLAWGRLPLHHAEAELANGCLIQMKIAGIAAKHRLPIKAMRRRAGSYGVVAQAFWQALTGSRRGLQDVARRRPTRRSGAAGQTRG
ncbi:MAG: LysR family transcriptional regulator [Stellaceae bacterium]